MGAALEVLPRLYAEVEAGRRARFGFVFIDADKVNSWGYFDWAVRMCGPGACVFVDNVVRSGSLANEHVVKDREWVLGSRKVVEMAGKDERVEAVVLQTVGEKTYDGFMMAVVK